MKEIRNKQELYLAIYDQWTGCRAEEDWDELLKEKKQKSGGTSAEEREREKEEREKKRKALEEREEGSFIWIYMRDTLCRSEAELILARVFEAPGGTAGSGNKADPGSMAYAGGKEETGSTAASGEKEGSAGEEPDVTEFNLPALSEGKYKKYSRILALHLLYEGDQKDAAGRLSHPGGQISKEQFISKWMELTGEKDPGKAEHPEKTERKILREAVEDFFTGNGISRKKQQNGTGKKNSIYGDDIRLYLAFRLFGEDRRPAGEATASADATTEECRNLYRTLLRTEDFGDLFLPIRSRPEMGSTVYLMGEEHFRKWKQGNVPKQNCYVVLLKLYDLLLYEDDPAVQYEVTWFTEGEDPVGEAFTALMEDSKSFYEDWNPTYDELLDWDIMDQEIPQGLRGFFRSDEEILDRREKREEREMEAQDLVAKDRAEAIKRRKALGR